MERSALDHAFEVTDRADFLPPGQRQWAHLDLPLPIGEGQTNSQPHTVANTLELLAPEPGDRVLDVGAGSGWTTALLAHLVGPGGRVIGVELEPTLAARAAENVRTQDLPWASVHQAEPGVLGLPADGPYDRILVSANAEHLPGALVEQLTPEGTLVIVVRSTLLRLRRRGGKTPEVSEHGSYRFVPLR